MEICCQAYLTYNNTVWYVLIRIINAKIIEILGTAKFSNSDILTGNMAISGVVESRNTLSWKTSRKTGAF
jgi:hypothetical protein